jgi:hypothetical protein
VKSFVDQSAMHGFRFFFLTADDPKRLVDLLGLRQRQDIPELIRDRLDHARSQVDWQFNWGRSVAYSVFYCNGKDQEWGFDGVWVDGNDLVYMTSGYVSASATRSDDHETCRSKG